MIDHVYISVTNIENSLAICSQVPLPGYPVPGPDRDRTHKMGDAVEART
jgi:hypothetical protein